MADAWELLRDLSSAGPNADAWELLQNVNSFHVLHPTDLNLTSDLISIECDANPLSISLEAEEVKAVAVIEINSNELSSVIASTELTTGSDCEYQL